MADEKPGDQQPATPKVEPKSDPRESAAPREEQRNDQAPVEKRTKQ